MRGPSLHHRVPQQSQVFLQINTHPKARKHSIEPRGPDRYRGTCSGGRCAFEVRTDSSGGSGLWLPPSARGCGLREEGSLYSLTTHQTSPPLARLGAVSQGQLAGSMEAWGQLFLYPVFPFATWH